ncbi:MAG: AMP-binding protein [Rhodobacteraceae bacterium]|nr:AMP-binding protein [Paracoccaceae bacterium]
MSTSGLYATLFEPHTSNSKAFLVLDDGRSLSFREFLKLARSIAGVLQRHGVVPGDRVAVQATKSAEALAIYAACARLGAALLPLNTSYTSDELAYLLGNAEPRVFVCDPTDAEQLEPVARSAGSTVLTLDANGAGTLIDAIDPDRPAPDVVPRDDDDLAAILYTSGTTGKPKGAMLTNRNLISNAQVLTALWQFTDNDVLLHALPIFHTHGLFVAMNVALASGATVRFMQTFNPDVIIEEMPRATTMMGVPTFYTRLLAHDGFDQDVAGHMRLFVSGSAPLLAETHKEFEVRTGLRILERYGMTETNMITSNPYKGERRAGTVGMPLEGVEVSITDPVSGTPLDQGARGMIEVRGPNVFAGYWRMPEKTAEEKRGNGFFITGDLGEIDGDGYLSIVGRAKDLIISGGYNIYPKEIELILDDMPNVIESAVVGVPHADMGEGVIAVLAASNGVDVAQIEAQIKTMVAGFKRPRRFYVVESLPRNTMGKVQKNALRDQFGDAFS